jgi:hypothetical protein
VEEFSVPAVRQWAIYAAAMSLLVELSACNSLPPSVSVGAPERPRTVAPMAPTSSGTVAPEAPTTPSKVRHSPEVPKAVAGRPDHVVVVVLENKHRSQVIGDRHAPYLNKLAGQGANMTRSYGVTHPSQPNYIALFSGSTRGVRSNACPQRFKKPQNLGSQLRRAGFSFTGYAEALPKAGFTGCVRGRYQRKHNPWVNFGNLPRSTNQPFSAFPRDYRKLPTVAFVSPDMCHGMHDCSVRTGDRWMKNHFDRYAQWAKRNNSWLVVTFDENAGGTIHPIFTILVGAGIRPGRYAERMNHYTLLRTIEKAYGLPPLGRAAKVRPLSKIWKT